MFVLDVHWPVNHVLPDLHALWESPGQKPHAVEANECSVHGHFFCQSKKGFPVKISVSRVCQVSRGAEHIFSVNCTSKNLQFALVLTDTCISQGSILESTRETINPGLRITS